MNDVGYVGLAVGSRWLCGNILASDANRPGSTPGGGTFDLDTGYYPFVGR